MTLAAIPVNPTESKPLTELRFDTLDLHPLLATGLAEAGFEFATPIQELTLPLALAGRDVAGQAQTGTGKTLAFLVALMNRLLTQPALAERKPEDPRALILAPTRELAIQIHKDALKFGANTGIRFALVYGGVDYEKQRELLQQGVDVIIATPGRLIDYVKQHKVVSLHACEVCVLDEADRMFDLGFIKDIRFLLRRMPIRTERQTLLFSATLSHRVLELAYEHMNEPEKVTVETEFVTADRVRQIVYFPANDEKIALLIGLLNHMDVARTMVFVNTKIWAEKIANALERKHFRVALLSGDVPQKKRERLLAKFQKGEVQVLVATDVAARGLHIDSVSHVFNFDLPQDAEDYVHRIGRTARLGAEGDAISFACERYAFSLPAIEEFVGQKLPVGTVDPSMLVHVERTPLDSSEKMSASDDPDDVLPRHIREKQAARGAAGASRSGSGSRTGSGSGPASRSRSAGASSGGSARGPARADAGGGERTQAPRRAPAADSVNTSASDAGDPSAASTPAMQNSAAPDAVGGDAASPARKRSRRGGRGRNRGSGATGEASAEGASAARSRSATSDTRSPGGARSANPDRAQRGGRSSGSERTPGGARAGNGGRGGAASGSARAPGGRSPSARAKPARSPESSGTGLIGTLKRGLGLLARGLGLGKKP